MLQTRPFYYEKNAPLPYRTFEQIYALRERLDNFQAKLFFKGDTSRVIWSDIVYAYRRRMEQLGEIGKGDPKDALQLPFVSYYRKGGWEVDDRPAASQLSSAINKFRWGKNWDTGIESQVIHAQRAFEGAAIFSSERDAEIAYTLIQWWKNRLYHDEYFLIGGNTKIAFPLSLELKSYELDSGKDLDKWSASQNIALVKYSFLVRTPLIKVDPNQPPVYLTKEVYWYFHNREFREGIEETENFPLEQSELFTLIETGEETLPETVAGLADIVVTIPSPTEVLFSWEYIGNKLPDSLEFIVHLGKEVRTEVLTYESGTTIENAPKEYLLTNLPSASLFDVQVLAYYGSRINKYHFSVETPSLPERKKGLAGLKGMTL
jgi:hypothetical protein